MNAWAKREIKSEHAERYIESWFVENKTMELVVVRDFHCGKLHFDAICFAFPLCRK